MDATFQVLGEKEILESSNQELLPHSLEANNNMIQSVGEQNKWDSLPEEEQKECLAVMMEQLVINLGKGAYEMLSDHENKIMKLFIWADCGCHKDLNDVNEGALGSFHVLMQWQPQLTLLQYNAQAMFYHTDTQTFMKNKFQAEDYKFIHQVAQESRGEEKNLFCMLKQRLPNKQMLLKRERQRQLQLLKK